jgi:hypothetical protein
MRSAARGVDRLDEGSRSGPRQLSLVRPIGSIKARTRFNRRAHGAGSPGQTNQTHATELGAPDQTRTGLPIYSPSLLGFCVCHHRAAIWICRRRRSSSSPNCSWSPAPGRGGRHLERGWRSSTPSSTRPPPPTCTATSLWRPTRWRRPVRWTRFLGRAAMERRDPVH